MVKYIESLDNLSRSGSGVLYIAFGKRYVDEAIISMESLKSFSDVPTCFYTDKPVKSPYIDYVHIISPEHPRAKVDFIDKTPFEKTLYLDSDTVCAYEISDIFDMFPRFDVAGVHCFSRKRKRWADMIPEYASIPYAFPEVNGGVFAYGNSPKAADFFALWKRYFYRYKDVTNGWDQASLRVALWESGASLASLPVEYNIRNANNRTKAHRLRAKETPADDLFAPRIFHMHAQDRFIDRLFNKRTVRSTLQFGRDNMYRY